jgi:hypothetical protein
MTIGSQQQKRTKRTQCAESAHCLTGTADLPMCAKLLL